MESIIPFLLVGAKPQILSHQIGSDGWGLGPG